MKNQMTNPQHPQRQAAAGVLLFGVLLASCQRTTSQAADSHTGPANVSSAATMQDETRRAPKVPAVGGQDLPAEACVKSEEGFSEFFGLFVQDRRVREFHSAPMIEVGDIKTPRQSVDVVALQKIEPFRISLVDSRWVYEEPGKPPGELVRVDVNRALDGDVMRVEFVRADFSAEDDVLRTIGDPEAYVFAFENGCWQLTKYLR